MTVQLNEMAVERLSCEDHYEVEFENTCEVQGGGAEGRGFDTR
jgi:hypothetical protein